VTVPNATYHLICLLHAAPSVIMPPSINFRFRILILEFNNPSAAILQLRTFDHTRKNSLTIWYLYDNCSA